MDWLSIQSFLFNKTTPLAPVPMTIDAPEIDATLSSFVPPGKALTFVSNLLFISAEICSAFSMLLEVINTSAFSNERSAAALCPTGPVPPKITALDIYDGNQGGSGSGGLENDVRITFLVNVWVGKGKLPEIDEFDTAAFRNELRREQSKAAEQELRTLH